MFVDFAELVCDLLTFTAAELSSSQTFSQTPRLGRSSSARLRRSDARLLLSGGYVENLQRERESFLKSETNSRWKWECPRPTCRPAGIKQAPYTTAGFLLKMDLLK